MTIAFDDADFAAKFEAMSPAEVDALEFGIIGIDAQTMVRLYNAYESKIAGLAPERVLGQPLFTHVAPCMNNFMVAQRFEDANNAGTSLDATIDYVLTLRMRPIKVKLRLLVRPDLPLRYVLILRAP